MLARGSSVPSAIVQHRFVTLQRQRFHYFAWGHSGAPVVLMHATGFHGYVWKPIAQGLSRDCQVLAPDQRGHGDSVKPEQGYGWHAFAEDLHQFLSTLRLQGVAAVGHSAGATAIAVCAATHAGLISRAVLIDPIMVSPPPDGEVRESPLAQRARKRRMVWESRTSMFHSFRARPPFNTWREDVLWAYIEEGTVLHSDGRIELKCPGAIEAQIYENAASLDVFALLPRITIPVLLLCGEASEAFPEAHARTVLSLLPQARMKTIARTTHFVPMERPEAVERAVRKFFSL